MIEAPETFHCERMNATIRVETCIGFQECGHLPCADCAQGRRVDGDAGVSESCSKHGETTPIAGGGGGFTSAPAARDGAGGETKSPVPAPCCRIEGCAREVGGFHTRGLCTRHWIMAINARAVARRHERRAGWLA